MTIQLNNLQLLQFYRDTYPDAEIMYQGRIIEKLESTKIESEAVEINEEEEIKKDSKNNKKTLINK